MYHWLVWNGYIDQTGLEFIEHHLPLLPKCWNLKGTHLFAWHCLLLYVCMCCWGRRLWTGEHRCLQSPARVSAPWAGATATFSGPLREQPKLLTIELSLQSRLSLWMNTFSLLLYPVLHIFRLLCLVSLLTQRFLHIFPFFHMQCTADSHSVFFLYPWSAEHTHKPSLRVPVTRLPGPQSIHY